MEVGLTISLSLKQPLPHPGRAYLKATVLPQQLHKTQGTRQSPLSNHQKLPLANNKTQNPRTPTHHHDKTTKSTYTNTSLRQNHQVHLHQHITKTLHPTTKHTRSRSLPKPSKNAYPKGSTSTRVVCCSVEKGKEKYITESEAK
ncbi:hypothetical protein E2C01_023013 [Portunus trituberculatus]|uniref:Uncharacterized protein n=1 Tax=Portunus trituberculatus TaxID=210409 RepID=A0A5B7EAF1_PORTR|nr:hypothetical protein [Portunus trituberculatus]